MSDLALHRLQQQTTTAQHMPAQNLLEKCSPLWKLHNLTQLRSHINNTKSYICCVIHICTFTLQFMDKWSSIIRHKTTFRAWSQIDNSSAKQISLMSSQAWKWCKQQPSSNKKLITRWEMPERDVMYYSLIVCVIKYCTDVSRWLGYKMAPCVTSTIYAPYKSRPLLLVTDDSPYYK